jgi:hypothetical protein
VIHIKTYLENITNEEIHPGRYNSLGTTPGHIHKDKKAHKDALLTLDDEIVTHIHRQSMPVVNYSPDIASTKVAAGHYFFINKSLAFHLRARDPPQNAKIGLRFFYMSPIRSGNPKFLLLICARVPIWQSM